MKKNILISFSCLLVLALHGQDITKPAGILRGLDVPKSTDEEVFLCDSALLYFFGTSPADSGVFGKNYMIYNDYGQIVLDSLLFRFDSVNWHLGNKTEYTYDQTHRLSSRTEYFSVPDTNIWIPDRQFEFAYLEESSRLDYVLQRIWNHSGEWEPEDSVRYSYNKLMQKEYEYKYRWYGVSQGYEILNHVYFVYDAQGLVTSDTTFSYGSYGVPEYNFLRLYDYDAQGNEIRYRSYDYVGDKSWSEVEKHEYTWDADGNRISDYRYEWDYGSSQWFNYERGFFTYDASNNMHLWMYWELDEDSQQWEKDFTYEFFWGLHTVVGTKERFYREITRVYPNPCNGVLHVEIGTETTISVYDLRGKLHMRHLLEKGSNTINMESLKPGLYLLRSDNGMIREKVILQ